MPANSRWDLIQAFKGQSRSENGRSLSYEISKQPTGGHE